MLEPIRAALADAMDESQRVVLLGQNVGRLGGVFRAAEGLHARFPGRVFGTPLAEGGIVGAAGGLAIASERDPVARVSAYALGAGLVDENAIVALQTEVRAELDAALDLAMSYPTPGPEEAFPHIFAT